MDKKNRYDFTVGPPLGKLIGFALPFVAVMILQNLYHTADAMVVGRFLGEDALAAVGASGQVSSLVLMLISGATTGMSVVVSQYFGAKDLVRLRKTIMTSLYMIVGLSLVFSILGAAFTRPLLALMGTPDNIMDGAATYLRIIFLGSLATAVYNMANAISRALGDSVTPLIVLVITALLNVGLDLLFVVPLRMGVAGAAYATVLAAALSAAACTVILVKKMPFIKPSPDALRWDGQIAGAVVKIGFPSVLQSSSMSLGNVLIQGIINSFGSTVIAAFSAATKIDNLMSWPPGGFTNAMQYYTGQNIGAGKPERIKDGVRASLIVVIGYSAAAALVTIPFRAQLMGLFSAGEGGMVKIGAEYLLIVASFWSFAGINHLFKSILTGAGDAMAAICCNVAEMAVRLVLSLVLSRSMGYLGVFIAAPCGWFAASVTGVLLYWRGRWKEKGVAGRTAAGPARLS